MGRRRGAGCGHAILAGKGAAAVFVGGRMNESQKLGTEGVGEIQVLALGPLVRMKLTSFPG